MTPLQHHLTLRPEMPRPFHPDSAVAIAWQRAMQWWVETKERLEIEERVAGIVIPGPDHNRPSCTPKADYLWRDMGGRKRPTKPAWSGATREYNRQKKAEQRERDRQARSVLIREGLMERRTA